MVTNYRLLFYFILHFLVFPVGQAVSKHYSPSYLLQHKLLDFVVLRPTGFVFLLLELRPAVNS